MIGCLAAGFGLSRRALLERGEAMLRPWKLCRAAERELQDRLLISPWPDEPAAGELQELKRRFSTADPGEVLRRAEGEGLLDVEAPEYGGYPLPAPESFPDGASDTRRTQPA